MTHEELIEALERYGFTTDPDSRNEKYSANISGLGEVEIMLMGSSILFNIYSLASGWLGVQLWMIDPDNLKGFISGSFIKERTMDGILWEYPFKIQMPEPGHEIMPEEPFDEEKYKEKLRKEMDKFCPKQGPKQ